MQHSAAIKQLGPGIDEASSKAPSNKEMRCDLPAATRSYSVLETPTVLSCLRSSLMQTSKKNEKDMLGNRAAQRVGIWIRDITRP